MISEKIFIIILNRNQKKITQNCLSSLKKVTYSPVNIIVVDNGSTDNSVRFLSRDFPEVEYICLPSNQGVAGGRNRGIEYALRNDADFVCLLDNDTLVDPGFLDPMVLAMKQNDNITMVVPKIYILGKERIIQRAGCPSWKLFYLSSAHSILQGLWEKCGRNGIQNILDLSRGWGQEDHGQFDRDEEVSFSIGACQLIRSSVFNDVGILDENFNPYGSEDIDFCERLSIAGYKILYKHDSVIWHREESSFSDNYDRVFYNTSHILLLARKHLRGIPLALFYLDFLMLNTPLRVLDYYLLGHRHKLKGLSDALSINIIRRHWSI